MKTDHKYLPKLTCIVNRIEISNPAVALDIHVSKTSERCWMLEEILLYWIISLLPRDILRLLALIGFLVGTENDQYKKV